MTANKLTAEVLDTTVRALIGRRITGIVYYDLPGSTDADWDHEDWHDVVMGVALTTADGTQYAASWGSSFDCYGIEMVPGTMGSYLINVGEPDGPRCWDVTSHPRWQSLLAAPVTDARVLWAAYPRDDTFKVPLVIHLAFPAGDAWLVAGTSAKWPHDGTFHLGTDDIIVGFTREFLEHLGLPDLGGRQPESGPESAA